MVGDERNVTPSLEAALHRALDIIPDEPTVR